MQTFVDIETARAQRRYPPETAKPVYPPAGKANGANGAIGIDLSVLDQGRREPPPIPLEVFGPWRGWIESAAEAAGCPADYVVAPLLVGFSTLIGNARSVSPWGGWVEPAVLWAGNVGDPSSNKSPGMDAVLAALRGIEATKAEGFEERHREWSALAEAATVVREAWQDEVKEAVKRRTPPPSMPEAAQVPPEPGLPRLVVNDATPEALAAVLAANPRGVMLHRDELPGWLEGMERYNAGGARAFYVEAFGARPFTVDRVKNGKPVRIPRLSVPILGNAQPDKLAQLLAGADDGLASRFCWFWPKPIPPRRPGRAASESFIGDAFARLANLAPLEVDGESQPVTMRLTPEAADLLQEWRIGHQADYANGHLESAFGKMPGMLLRLSLLLELGWWSATPAPEPETVSSKAIRAAAGFVDSYLKPMARRVYGDAGLPVAERNAATLARWIKVNKPERINLRNLRRDERLPGLRTAGAVAEAVDALVEAGWLIPDSHRQGGTPGRERADYTVAPEVRT